MSEEQHQAILEELESFTDRVYWLVGMVPEGRVATYGQIATYAGSPGAARAVGNLMRDSFAHRVDVPWQRIINSTGGISFKGDRERADLQRHVLADEGVVFNHRGKCDLTMTRWSPSSTFWAEVAQ